MSLDLTKLSPAPWSHGRSKTESLVAVRGGEREIIGLCREADAGFIDLARNAFEVMMRRGWYAERRSGGWFVCESPNGDCVDGGFWPDPFTALVEADRWYAENVEGKP